MGYRSDVRIVTSKKGFDKLNKYVEEYLKDKPNGEKFNLLENLDLYKENSYSCYFGWDSIKWYDCCDYIDVDAILNGLDDLKEKDYSYRFARIGESYDDYEEDSHESEKESEQDLEYPYMPRYFNDDILLTSKQEEIEI